MSRCLCCQKPLEAAGQYHPRCIIRLFGSSRLPAIPFGLADMPALIAGMHGRMSISGVQMKVSVRLNREKWKLEAAATQGTHILKPETGRFPELPQNENLCMNMAAGLGMPVPPHGLFFMADGTPCYIIKRFDRTDDGLKLQKETMFQILESRDKYSGSVEKVGSAICAHVANVGLDIIDFFERVLFCFLTGNGDMHLKNWALMTGQKKISLAPCYDLVCSRIYIPDEDETALTINGKRNNLKRSDFEELGGRLKIDEKAMENIFKKFKDAQEGLCRMCRDSEIKTGLQKKFLDVIVSRYKQLHAL